MIATGIFAENVGLIYGDPTVFFKHLLAIVIVGVFTFGGSYILFRITDSIITLRVRPEQEELGLDLSQHAETISTKIAANYFLAGIIGSKQAESESDIVRDAGACGADASASFLRRTLSQA